MKSMLRTITRSIKGLTLTAITAAEHHTLLHRFMLKALKREMLVKVTGLECLPEEYVKDNYQVHERLDTNSYHCCRASHSII